MRLHASLLLSCKACIGYQLSEDGRFLNRKDQGAWMRREKGGGCLLRPEKERLFAEGASYTVTTLSRDDQRQDSGYGSQLLIWQAREALVQLVLADLERGRKGGFRERLPPAHL